MLAIAAMFATPVSAAEISTHVLDLQSGLGGAGVPVLLMKKSADGSWAKVATAETSENGRIKSFGNSALFKEGTYKLTFDMTSYHKSEAETFFPEINLVFNVIDASAHYHVPVVVSPYGYSTYRGN